MAGGHAKDSVWKVLIFSTPVGGGAREGAGAGAAGGNQGASIRLAVCRVQGFRPFTRRVASLFGTGMAVSDTMPAEAIHSRRTSVKVHGAAWEQAYGATAGLGTLAARRVVISSCSAPQMCTKSDVTSSWR